jgi:cyclopropane-fatty-acyl-phospholipid synthase
VHYSRTLEAWLVAHDARRAAVLPVLEGAYGGKDAGWVWYNRWRLFYLACSELFRYNGGEEWGVGHYLLEKK